MALKASKYGIADIKSAKLLPTSLTTITRIYTTEHIV